MIHWLKMRKLIGSEIRGRGVDYFTLSANQLECLSFRMIRGIKECHPFVNRITIDITHNKDYSSSRWGPGFRDIKFEIQFFIMDSDRYYIDIYLRRFAEETVADEVYEINIDAFNHQIFRINEEIKFLYNRDHIGR